MSRVAPAKHVVIDREAAEFNTGLLPRIHLIILHLNERTIHSWGFDSVHRLQAQGDN